MSDHDKPGTGFLQAAARAAKPAAQEAFARLGKVTGVGITRSGEGYGLKVNLQREVSAGTEVPKEVQGVPVKVEVVGTVKKRTG
jgi:hypothetical protein